MKIYDPQKTHFRDLLTRHQGSDEFFTRKEDVEKELSRYPIEQFQGKRILCPCDSPTSAFTQYFRANYHRLGLAHLTATCIDGTRYDFDGAEETITQLESGDVFGAEVRAILQESDIVITNPPFSRKGEFLDLLLDWGGQFSFICLNLSVNNRSYWDAYMAGKLSVSGTVTQFATDKGEPREPLVACRWYSNMTRETTLRPLPCVPFNADTAMWAEQTWDGERILNVDKVKLLPAYDGYICCPIGIITDGYDVGSIDIRGIIRAVVNGKSRFARVVFKRK